MLPLRQQQLLVEQYSIIPDLHERMALLVDRARKRPKLPAEQRTDANLVKGCSSRVWLVGSVEEGRCHFQVDADSTLVRGLASLVCEVYEGATPEEVAQVEAQVLEELGVAANLSPTRVYGLEQVRRTVRAFGAAAGGAEA